MDHADGLPAVANGALMRAENVVVTARDEGFLRGDGVFEVIRLYEGRPFALGEHIERMSRSAERLRLAFSAEDAIRDISLLLSAAGPFDGALRLIATRGQFRLAVVEPIHKLPSSLSLRTVEYQPTGLMNGVKSLSYAGNMLARRVAVEQGADDALLVRPDGAILEGPTSAFFYIRDGAVFTPPITEGILASITRRHLLAISDAKEQPISVDELASVDEAFFASTLREVHPVHCLDGKALPGLNGRVTSRIAAEMRAHVQSLLDRDAAPNDRSVVASQDQTL
jgi:branched-chain amino acid aminotransferase